jgi:hypothetical protein
MLARQVNHGRVQEFMRSYEDATRRPHGYLMLDLKPKADDQQRLKTNILPGEADALVEYVRKKSYQQPPLVNAMYDAEQRMQEIMEAPQLTTVEKSKLYSDQLNRFLTFKNKMDVPAHYQEAPVQRTSLVSPTPVSERCHHRWLLPIKPNFLIPPPTEGERPRLKRNFFHNWVDSVDWKESDMAMMKPKERERYERFFTKRKAEIYSNEA